MIILGIALFALLVVVHELGHFIAARRNNVAVEEFGIGFPPRLFGRKFGDTIYTLNLIPLGGFVKLKGESDSDSEPESFGAAGLWAKTKILLAGVGMNVVAAIVIIFLLALVSLPQILPNQYRLEANETIASEAVVIANVGNDTAAMAAGLEQGDMILAINEEPITSAEHLQAVTERWRGQEVTLVYQRDRSERETSVQLAAESEGGYLGVAPVDLSTSRYSWGAPIVAVAVTLQMIWLVLSAIGAMIVGFISGGGGEAVDQLTGPVGIVFLLQNLGTFGLEYLLFLIASISVSLAVFNALPIPALDGGRLSLIAGARLLKKRLTPEVENAVHGLGFILLIGLFIVITYVDVQRFF